MFQFACDSLGFSLSNLPQVSVVSVGHLGMPRTIGFRIVVVIIIVIVAVVVGAAVQLICISIVIASAQVEQSITRIGQICVNGLLTVGLLLVAS